MSYLITVNDSNKANEALSKIERYNTAGELSFKIDELNDFDVITGLNFISKNAGFEFVSTLRPIEFIETVNKFLGL